MPPACVGDSQLSKSYPGISHESALPFNLDSVTQIVIPNLKEYTNAKRAVNFYYLFSYFFVIESCV